MRAFGTFRKHQSSLLRAGELSFFVLALFSSSRWSMMVKLLASKELPMEDPVGNIPAVAVAFERETCCASRLVSSNMRMAWLRLW